MRYFLVASFALMLSSSAFAQSTTYALDLRFAATSNLFSFPVNTPLVQTQIGPVGGLPYTTFAMDFDSAGTTLHIVNNTPTVSFEMGTLNTSTGVYTSGPAITGPLAGVGHSGLSVDPTTETFFVSTTSSLFTVDPITGASTAVGGFTGLTPTSAPIGLIIDIAVSPSGQMFGHDISNDALWSIDKTTGAGTFIGFSGLAGNFAQGMDFDPATGLLYAAIYTGGGTGSYGTWDTTSGVFTQILDLPSFPDPSANGRELELAISAVPEPHFLLALAGILGFSIFFRRR